MPVGPLGEVLPIAYGMPSREMFEESLTSQMALGGCMIWPESRDWRCVACGMDWRADEAGA